MQFSHALADVQDLGDGVALHFSGQAGVQAHYVVAADGYFSPTREIVLGDGPPDFQVGPDSACSVVR